MVNSTEIFFFFLELILIKDVLEALSESQGTGTASCAGWGREVEVARRLGQGEVAAEGGKHAGPSQCSPRDP